MKGRIHGSSAQDPNPLQYFGILDPNPDPKEYADARGKISTKSC